MKITFSRKPTHYDIHGTPVYLSDCGTYRLVHRRHGVVLQNGKAETDYWDLHMLRGKNDWVVIRTRNKTKSETIQEATIHAALLAVQLQMEKNDAAKVRSDRNANHDPSGNKSTRKGKRRRG